MSHFQELLHLKVGQKREKRRVWIQKYQSELTVKSIKLHLGSRNLQPVNHILYLLFSKLNPGGSLHGTYNSICNSSGFIYNNKHKRGQSGSQINLFGYAILTCQRPDERDGHMDRFAGIKVRIISVTSQIAFKCNDNSAVWSQTRIFFQIFKITR